MRLSQSSSLILTLLSSSVGCHRAAPASDPDLESATAFVRAFYRWYIPSANGKAGWQDAIRDSTALFAPGLLRALRADADAQAHAKSSDGIVGLDWDPFVGAQDYCDTADAYEVGGARRRAQEVLVDVRGKCWQHALPVVVEEAECHPLQMEATGP